METGKMPVLRSRGGDIVSRFFENIDASRINPVHGLLGIGTMATPQGLWPALMTAVCLPPAKSTTEMSLEGPLATNNCLPSGDIAKPHGRGPTLMVLAILRLGTSTTQIDAPQPVLRYSCLPSLDITRHNGRELVGS